jgi:hypothetical protein
MRAYTLTSGDAGAVRGDEPRSGSLPDVPGLSKGHKRTDSNTNPIKLTFWDGAMLVRLDGFRGGDPNQKPPEAGKRDKISEFSRKSRLNLKRNLGKMKTEALGVATSITLTIPTWCPVAWDPELYKPCLKRFNQELVREFGASGFWKLEFTKKNAAHFHLLVFDLPAGVIEWVSETWYRIVGTEDERHLRAGTNVESVRNAGGAVSYMAKYIQKDDEQMIGVHTGRYWGTFNKANLPVGEEKEVQILPDVAHKLRRIMRKKIRNDVRRSQWAKKFRELGDDNPMGVSTPYELERYIQLARSGSKKAFHRKWWGIHPLDDYRCELICWSPPSMFYLRSYRVTRKVGIAITLGVRPPPRLRSIRDGFTINLLCGNAEAFVARMLESTEATPD